MLYGDRFEISHPLAERLGLWAGATVALEPCRLTKANYFLVIGPNVDNGRQLEATGTNNRLSFTDMQASLALRTLFSLVSAEQCFILPQDGYKEGDNVGYMLSLHTPEPVTATA